MKEEQIKPINEEVNEQKVKIEKDETEKKYNENSGETFINNLPTWSIEPPLEINRSKK